MGKVTYSPGIEFVNGSLAKPKKQDGHKHGDYLIGTHRTAPTQNPDCTRIYIRKGDTYERSTPLSAKEEAIRLRFAEVAQAVKLRAKDLNKMTQDQEAFVAQRETGKKTMRAYLWMVCGQEYDAAH